MLEASVCLVGQILWKAGIVYASRLWHNLLCVLDFTEEWHTAEVAIRKVCIRITSTVLIQISFALWTL